MEKRPGKFLFFVDNNSLRSALGLNYLLARLQINPEL